MSNTSENHDVLIVGAGPVGLLIAVQLQSFGITHRIIEKRTQRQPFSKAFGVHSRTLEVFEDLGLLDEVFDKAVNVDNMSIYSNGKRLIHYNFDVLDVPHQLVASIPQCDVEEILEKEYIRLGGKLEREVELISFESNNDGVTVEIEKNAVSGSATSVADRVRETSHYKYLLASDGNKSAVREGLNIPYVGDEYAVPYIIADGVLDWDGDDKSGHIYVAGGGYVMFFPLPGGLTRIVVDEPTGNINSENITTEIVNEYILNKGIKNATFSLPSWLTVTPFRRRIIENYQSNNIFFAGDACHVHSPIGGQGMNTGIQDGYNLAWKIIHKLKFGASDKLLSSYNPERRPVAQMVLQRTDLQMKLLGLRNPILCFFRDLVIPKIARTMKFQKDVVGQAGGFLVDYTASELSYKPSGGKVSMSNGSIKVGSRMIDALMYDTVTRHGAKRRIYDLMQGNHYSLFVFADDVNSVLASKLENMKYSRPEFLQKICIVGDFSAPILKAKKLSLFHESLSDIEGEVKSKHNIKNNTVLLVRPDAYVALQCSTSDIDVCTKYLDNLYCDFPQFDDSANGRSVGGSVRVKSNKYAEIEHV